LPETIQSAGLKGSTHLPFKALICNFALVKSPEEIRVAALKDANLLDFLTNRTTSCKNSRVKRLQICSYLQHLDCNDLYVNVQYFTYWNLGLVQSQGSYSLKAILEK
jgi:hypothetical protein